MAKYNPDDNDKAKPVSAIYFHKPIKWPGVAGAATSIRTGVPTTTANAMYVDSIFLYKGDFLVNGKQFMPKTSGAIQCYEF